MNVVFLIPLVYLIAATIRGYKRGLIRSMLGFSSWVISIIIAVCLTKEFAMSQSMPAFAHLFEGMAGTELARATALLIIFVILLAMIKLFCNIITKATNVFAKIPGVNKTDQVLGGLVGLLKGGLLFFLLYLIYSTYSGTYVSILQQGGYWYMAILGAIKDACLGLLNAMRNLIG